MPSGTTGGKPTKSQARSAPRPPVQSRTCLTRARRSGTSARMERVVGPERARELEPLGELVDHDHGAGAHLAGHRDGLDAEAPGALDHDALPEREAGPGEPEDHLGEGAVRPGTRGRRGGRRGRGRRSRRGGGSSTRRTPRPSAGTRPGRWRARSWQGRQPAGPGGTRSSGRRDRSSSRRRGRPRGAAARGSPTGRRPRAPPRARSSRARRSSRRAGARAARPRARSGGPSRRRSRGSRAPARPRARARGAGAREARRAGPVPGTRRPCRCGPSWEDLLGRKMGGARPC